MTKLNKGMYYEIYDRIYCIDKIIENALVKTRVIDTSDKWHGLLRSSRILLQVLANEVYKEVDTPLKLEAIDRSCWVFELINYLLIEHPEIIHDSKAKRLATAASDSVYKLYQYIGSKDIDYATKPKPNRIGKRVRKGAKRAL